MTKLSTTADAEDAEEILFETGLSLLSSVSSVVEHDVVMHSIYKSGRRVCQSVFDSNACAAA